MKKYKLYFPILLVLLLSACSIEFDVEYKIKELEKSDTYKIEEQKYDIEDYQVMTLNIYKNKKIILSFYYQEKNKDNNYLIFYNYNKKIKAEQYYAIEPTNVIPRQKNSYIKEIDKLEKEYYQELELIELNEDQLIQIVKYYFNKK